MADQRYWDSLWQGSPVLQELSEGKQNEYLGPEIERCLERHCPEGGVCFLEAGCGLGVWNFLMEKKGAVALSVGVDKSRHLWDAQSFKREHSLKSDFIQADVTYLPFQDSSFDFVTSLGVIEHFERPLELLLELKRVLRPGGVLFIDTPNRSFWSFYNSIFPIDEHEDYYRPWQLAELVAAAGFSVQEAYSKGFSNSIMTPLYLMYDYDPASLPSRAYHFLLQWVKRVLLPMDRRLDGKYGFYSIVTARKP